MPSTYAHFRFGQLVLSGLSPQQKQLLTRYRQLFLVGLHGPDLFFYYNPIWNTEVGRLGYTYHGQSGQEFFSRGLEVMRDPPQQAYLYGVLGHYCLDSLCHPLICRWDEAGIASHVTIETEFDRHLLFLDGEKSPHTRNTGKHLHLTDREAQVVAGLYPPATRRQIQWCLGVMAQCSRILALPEGMPRKVVTGLMGCAGPYARDMVMGRESDPRCESCNRRLLALFYQAVERYPVMLQQLEAENLGALFSATF